MTIMSWTGAQSEGILLASYPFGMRVAIDGCDDAVEYRFRGGQWFDAAGYLVEIQIHENATFLDSDEIVDYPTESPAVRDSSRLN